MKKLLHPLIPLFLLLFLGGKYIYDAFLTEKYDEKEILLLEQTKKDAERLSKTLKNVADRSKYLVHSHIEETGSPKHLLVHLERVKKLEEVYEKYSQKINQIDSLQKLSFDNEDSQKKYNQNITIENIAVQSIFQNYIQEIRKTDTLLAQKYKDYVFHDDMTNQEIEKKYLKGKSIEVLIHLGRIKAELASIHSEATTLLAEEYIYFPQTDRAENNFILPILKVKKEIAYGVSAVEISSFDYLTLKNTSNRENFKTNFKFHINEDGFLVIDEENFNEKDLRLKWFPVVEYKSYLEYGKGWHNEL
ncbi:hypothetical protein [Bernardetia sp.]|uniref:hypothetical protein n=1 Tax=Bernardetia sp. TaxID=1937974 RepID=UPI0025C1F4A7|nr:hypothetical protein [Bernardetia sp.]